MNNRKLCRLIVCSQGYPAGWIDSLSEDELDELVALCTEDGAIAESKLVHGFKEFLDRRRRLQEAEHGKAVIDELGTSETVSEVESNK